MTVPTHLCRLTALPLVVLLVCAGCSSDPGPGERHAGFAGARSKPPPPLAGQEKFFDGQILAEIKVGTDGVPEVDSSEGGGSRGGGENRGRHGGGGSGGLNIAGSGGAVGGNVSGGIPFGGGGGHGRRGGNGENGGGGPAAGPRPVMGGGLGRPVMIHLRFTNRGPEALALHIDDFVSPLGNFAVRPEKLVLEPGQSLETEPMSSQLAGQFSEADATLVLRLGAKAEKKTFTLHALPGDLSRDAGRATDPGLAAASNKVPGPLAGQQAGTVPPPVPAQPETPAK
ncbi:MAG: hypothetical protein PSU94_08890 [Lacunisphaera sp.]|nr:hypothetical protein [Lacunisphaera sp.]